MAIIGLDETFNRRANTKQITGAGGEPLRTNLRDVLTINASVQNRPVSEGLGGPDVFDGSTISSGGGGEFTDVPGEGEMWVIDRMELHAPAIAGSTGTHSFQIESNDGVNILFGESNGTSELHWDNSEWDTADSQQAPSDPALIADALSSVVAVGLDPGQDGLPAPFRVTYSNDTDTDQTGNITIDIHIRVTRRVVEMEQ